MTIEISPEDRLLVQSLVEAGEYESVESCIHAALAGLSGQLDEEVATHIGQGIFQLESGQAKTSEQVLRNLAARRANWIEKQAAT